MKIKVALYQLSSYLCTQTIISIVFYYLKNVILLSWLFAVSFSSVGLNLHRIYCLCTQSITTSFMQADEDDCDKCKDVLQSHSDCCKSKVDSKLCEKEKDNNKHENCKKSKCSQQETIFLKLNTPFTFVDHKIDGLKSFVKEFVFNPTFDDSSCFYDFYYVANLDVNRFRKPPDIKKLVVLSLSDSIAKLQVFRC